MSKISGLLFLSLILMSCHPEEEALLLGEGTQLGVPGTAANRLSVRNIAELKNVRAPNGTRKEVRVMGYYEPGDGGGGTFIWDSNSTQQENGGTVFETAGMETGRWVRNFTGSLNVKWFGARGDGESDDRPAISTSLRIGLQTPISVFFPKGEYKILSGETPSVGFQLIKPTDFSIYGEEGTIISTPLGEDEGFKLFYILYGGENMEVKNISFKNTHGITDHRTTAIQIIQGRGEALKNLSIKNCSFTGFSTAILPNGTVDLLIEGCDFYAPKGRDHAVNNRDPAVYIWLHSNLNGDTQNTIIRNCYAEGFSGSDITATSTKEPMDGFLYGTGNGVTVENNVLEKMGYEAIFLQPHTEFVSSEDKKPVVIQNNDIRFIALEGAREHRSYGIRVDDSAVNISNNFISGATFGILIYGFDYTYKFSKIKLKDNVITLDNNPLYKSRAIFVQGNRNHRVEKVEVLKNTIKLENYSLSENSELIFFADAEAVDISNNTFEVKVEKNGHSLNLIGFDRVNKNFCLWKNKGDGNFDEVYVHIGLSSPENFSFENENCRANRQ